LGARQVVLLVAPMAWLYDGGTHCVHTLVPVVSAYVLPSQGTHALDADAPVDVR
jgi:hypothetical protein